MTFGYNSSVAAVGGGTSNQFLHDHADSLVGKLAEKRDTVSALKKLSKDTALTNQIDRTCRNDVRSSLSATHSAVSSANERLSPHAAFSTKICYISVAFICLRLVSSSWERRILARTSPKWVF